MSVDMSPRRGDASPPDFGGEALGEFINDSSPPELFHRVGCGARRHHTLLRRRRLEVPPQLSELRPENLPGNKYLCHHHMLFPAVTEVVTGGDRRQTESVWLQVSG